MSRTLCRGVAAASIMAVLFVMVDVGCRQNAERSGDALNQQYLSTNAGSVLGFERPADWHVISGPAIPLNTSATHSQGGASLAVRARNYVALQSATIAVSSAIDGPISYDLSLPTPANPSWAGTTQLFVDCHSQSVFNQFLGQRELTGLPIGKFTTSTYTLPGPIRTALSHGCRDLGFTVVVNVSSNSTGSYLLDNIQLAGPPTLTACAKTTPAPDAGAAASGLVFSTKLSRPDVGNFTLDWTFQPSGPTTTNTVAIKLNGNPLLRVVSELGGGTRQSIVTYSPPLAGIQQVSTTSDGQTMVITVDGRQTVPAPVGADPSTIRFVDGGPVPQLVVNPAIQDALLALTNDVPASSAACAAKVSAPSGSDGVGVADLLAAPTPRQPPIGSLGPDPDPCAICEIECNLRYFGCQGGAAAACILGGPFACAGAVTTCVGVQIKCIVGCHNDGTACCPVGCKDVGEYSQPQCCAKNFSCLVPAGDTTALCCPSATIPCGGADCCGSDQQCVPTRGPASRTAFCCNGPGQTTCGNVCCSGGLRCTPGGGSGCCIECQTDAQCTGGDFCVNGCCANG
jgi:hypothetical protein